MSREKFRPFDAADYLKDEETIAAYLEAAVDGGNEQHLARAKETVRRAKEKLSQKKRR